MKATQYNITPKIHLLKKAIALSIVLLPLLLWSKPNYYFQDVTDGHNLSNIGFYTICEDDNGFLWCGGFNGLYYHNTLSIKKVKLQNMPPHHTTAPRVYKIYKDRKKMLWICTNIGLFKYERATATFEKQHLNFRDSTENERKTINTIVQLNDDEYLLQKQQSIWLFNAKTASVKGGPSLLKKNARLLSQDESGTTYIVHQEKKVYRFTNNLQDIRLLYNSPGGIISSICKDGNKFYIGYKDKGVVIIHANGKVIDQFNSQEKGRQYIKNNHVSKIIRRHNGELWIATNEGIYIHTQNTLTLLDSRLENGLPHRRIYDLHLGLHNKVWVSTYSGGIAVHSDDNYQFKHILLDYPQKELDKRHVATICEDHRGYIWIGNEDEGGIKVYDPKHLRYIKGLPSAFHRQSRDVKTIVNINDDCIVYGQSSSNTMKVYNYTSGTFEEPIELPLKKQPGVRGAYYKQGLLWVHDPNNIVAYNIQEEKIKMLINSPARIWQLFFDSSHNLWVGTSKGLYILRPGMKELAQCLPGPGPHLLKDASIYTICEGQDGKLWVGTTGQGLYLYNPEQQKLMPAPDHHLTSSADIYKLIKDQQNNIWYITNKGLFHYNTAQGKTTYYGTNKGTLNAQNRLNASILSTSGQLYFGAKNGFTIIDPSTINKNTITPSVFLADFKVNNTPYASSSGMPHNSLILSELTSVELNANKNTLSFKVVSNNFIKSASNTYKYRLKNYDDHWVKAGQNNAIVFTKVPPGHYIFEAYGTNNDAVWSKHPYQLDIHILQPLFLRWYALSFYIIILTGIGWLVYKELNAKLKLRQEIAVAHNRSKVNEMIHAERIKLFTNISHELRTPLSLIISPISYILSKATTDDETTQLLKVADRNAKRLHKIADQTIDFRLLEVGKLKPKVDTHDIIQLTKEVYLCFEQQFIDHQINTAFTSDFKRYTVQTDGDMIEKIIYNLLSNALKYTNEGDSIRLIIEQIQLEAKDYNKATYTGVPFEGKALSISISDSGPGIQQDVLPHIFERFAKGNQIHQTSTGIGLHLCSEYARMNHANLQLITQEGEGTSFTLNLPLHEHTSYEKSELKNMVKLNNSTTIPATQETEDKHKRSETILLVEDNSELRDYLKTFLSKHYKVITAKHAEQALKQLQHLNPQLILTDVAMPGINGIELSKQIKKDQRYGHIPIIIITAYAERNYQMESILCGAEAFFTKPIDQQMLLAQINTSINKQIVEATKTTKVSPDDANSFINKARKIVEDNLQNPDFQIVDLLKALNISKTTLTRKLKAETQENASSFIRNIRLENAQKLLSNNAFNIDEIAPFVGFNYTSYFIKSFKDKYGVTPSDYRKKIRQKK